MDLCVAGFLIDFISGPVNSGFTSAVAILIITSQIKDLIGIKAVGTTLLDMAISIYRDVHNAKLGDTVFGIVCIVVIISLRVSGYPGGVYRFLLIGIASDFSEWLCVKSARRT